MDIIIKRKKLDMIIKKRTLYKKIKQIIYSTKYNPSFNNYSNTIEVITILKEESKFFLNF